MGGHGLPRGSRFDNTAAGLDPGLRRDPSARRATGVSRHGARGDAFRRGCHSHGQRRCQGCPQDVSFKCCFALFGRCNFRLPLPSKPLPIYGLALGFLAPPTTAGGTFIYLFLFSPIAKEGGSFAIGTYYKAGLHRTGRPLPACLLYAGVSSVRLLLNYFWGIARIKITPHPYSVLDTQRGR